MMMSSSSRKNLGGVIQLGFFGWHWESHWDNFCDISGIGIGTNYMGFWVLGEIWDLNWDKLCHIDYY